MNPNTVLKFELTLQEVNIILMALQEVPAKLCNPISETLKAQAQAQLQPAEPEKNIPHIVH